MISGVFVSIKKADILLKLTINKIYLTVIGSYETKTQIQLRPKVLGTTQKAFPSFLQHTASL